MTDGKLIRNKVFSFLRVFLKPPREQGCLIMYVMYVEVFANEGVIDLARISQEHLCELFIYFRILTKI